MTCDIIPVEMRASRRRALQEQLVRVIMRVLCRNLDLHYYQVIVVIGYQNSLTSAIFTCSNNDKITNHYYQQLT